MPDQTAQVTIVISGQAQGLQRTLAEAEVALRRFGTAADRASAQAGTKLAEGEARAGHEATSLAAWAWPPTPWTSLALISTRLPRPCWSARPSGAGAAPPVDSPASLVLPYTAAGRRALAPEFEAFGIPFDHKVDRFEEALAAVLRGPTKPRTATSLRCVLHHPWLGELHDPLAPTRL
jgi:hypothetical protein